MHYKGILELIIHCVYYTSVGAALASTKAIQPSSKVRFLDCKALCDKHKAGFFSLSLSHKVMGMTYIIANAKAAANIFSLHVISDSSFMNIKPSQGEPRLRFF